MSKSKASIRDWLRQQAAKGGKSRSKAKVQAARRNIRLARAHKKK